MHCTDRRPLYRVAPGNISMFQEIVLLSRSAPQIAKQELSSTPLVPRPIIFVFLLITPFNLSKQSTAELA